ncbi:glycoside hydrolase family 16 protein [Mycena albidolilacea]|uniref:Glycoside hydrolase family 16 protein n=1 Tax=Mycena albidolilacea TaxID=1033008 RepID=A0AAD6ZQR3_9AGAR|nr:glycoside hydrolase family 16 protein [Mycena albidolilacea]
MHITILIALLSLTHLNLGYAHTTLETCEEYHVTFDGSELASESFDSHFITISPAKSYALTNNGLEIYLHKPEGHVTTSNGTNDKLGDGATIHSTFTLFHGKVTFKIESPALPGAIVAVILIGDTSNDEIDIEYICSEPHTWQTNVFVTDPREPEPEYGVFSTKENVDSITVLHEYSIEVTSESISWSLDRNVVRRLLKSECTRNGFSHYPSHSMRLQIGIWDASEHAGTAEWAGGPINWKKEPADKVMATIKSINVECSSG